MTDNKSVSKEETVNNKEYFKTMKEKGEHCERLLQQYFKDHGWSTRLTTGKDSRFDLEVKKDGIPVSFEVKYNDKVNKYDTVFVETHQSGYKSGLCTTKAMYQAHFNEDFECRIMETSKLKQLIKDQQLPMSHTNMKTKSGKISGSGYRVFWMDFLIKIDVPKIMASKTLK